MPFTDARDAELLDAIFDVFGATLYVGFSTTTPTKTGTNVTEPSSGGYAREAITAAEFAAASAGDPSSKATDTLLDFGTASGDWAAGANLTHWVIFDLSSAGDETNVVAFAALDTPKPVLSGDPVTIPVGDLAFELGAVADFA